MIYIKIEQALIMNVDKTVNGFTLTNELVLNSIGTFKNRPIVYNKKQEFKNYPEPNFDNYKNETVIGFIEGNINVTDTEVFADIIIWDKYKDLWKGKYDNWCINFPQDDDKSKFELESIEVF